MLQGKMFLLVGLIDARSDHRRRHRAVAAFANPLLSSIALSRHADRSSPAVKPPAHASD